MKIRVERDGFAEAVTWVARSLPARPTEPVLGGLLLSAPNTDQLTLSAFDYEVSAQVTVDAQVDPPGQVLVSGRLLADIIKALPPRPVDMAVEDTRVTITCGNSRFSLPLMPAEDYPQLPQLPDYAGSVPGELFSEAVSQVAVAAGKDDTLPMLTGLRLEIGAETCTLVATDRFRLALREFEWQAAEPEDTALLIPARALADTAKTLGTAGALVDISLASGQGLLGLSTSNTSQAAGSSENAPHRHTTSRLLDAEFPPYRHLLPEEDPPNSALIEVGPLIEAVKRVSLVERGAQVRLEFNESGLRLAVGGSDDGNAEEHLPVEFVGDEIVTAFNPDYLNDALNALRSPHARMFFTAGTKPALIKPVDEQGNTIDGYLHLLMPVRLPG